MTDAGSTAERLPVGPRGRLAQAVADAVDAVGGARRTGGSGVEVATQYAGGRALGVHLGDDEVTVHIVAERLPLDSVVEGVRSAAQQTMAATGDRRPVAVVVEDLDVTSLPGGIR